MSELTPRRVLLLTYEYPPLGGGGGVIFRHFAEELSRYLDVTVLTSGRRDLRRSSAGLVARKGLGDLLEVLAGLRDPHVRLLVLGEGPLRGELEQRAGELGLAQRVRFMGFVTDEEKWQLLGLSDLYVSTSLHEGFGIVFLEAMESGVPVICYDCGGQVDFVSSAVGALVPAGDSSAFGAELRRHVVSPELRGEKGRAAREHAKGYHIDEHAARYLRIYEECLAAAAGRGETGFGKAVRSVSLALCCAPQWVAVGFTAHSHGGGALERSFGGAPRRGERRSAELCGALQQ